MDEATAARYAEQNPITAEASSYLSVAEQKYGSRSDRSNRQALTLSEVKNVLRQETAIFAHLMNGTSPFGDGVPVAPSWADDGAQLALHVMRGLHALKDHENGLTLVIACAGAYQKGRMDHLMVWNISMASGIPMLQVANHENIGGKHYPTDKVNTVALWQKHDPAGSKNSNAAATPVDTFATTPLGISAARHGLYINFFPSTASENFEVALTTLCAMEAGQSFGFFDGQKSCFTTARDLLGAIGTKGPRGEKIDWGAGQPQPVVPEIFNKLSLLTNNERPVGIETACGKSWDLNDRRTRQHVLQDKALFATLATKLGGWINRKPDAYAVHIRPAVPAML